MIIGGLALLGMAGCRFAPWPEEVPLPEEEQAGTETIYSLIPEVEIIRSAGPADLSSITHVSNQVYLAASDSGGTICEVVVQRSGRPNSLPRFTVRRTFVLENGKDIEGLAYDPLCGTVWAADEADGSIVEHDLEDGRSLRILDSPECFRRCRPNQGLESLAMRPNGLELWTCNEQALEGDGDECQPETGTLVRLTRFSRANGRDDWRLTGQWAYRTGRIHGGFFRGMRVRSVVDLSVMEDGTVLVLERELSCRATIPSFMSYIYRVDCANATDVRDFATLRSPYIVPVLRQRLFAEDVGFANYEGMCIGPQGEGEIPLLLVSDGDDGAFACLYWLSLSAIF